MSASTTSSRDVIRSSKLATQTKRDALVSAQIANHIAAQIYNLRRDRSWTQTQLAKRAGMAQGRVSLLEDSNYDKITLRTLKRLASAFGVALRVELISFGDFLAWTGEMSPRDVRIPAFDDDAMGAGSFEPVAIQINPNNIPVPNRAVGALLRREPKEIAPPIDRRRPNEPAQNESPSLSARDIVAGSQSLARGNSVFATAQP